jgi:thiol-disulfide isomerase/thioredoxin
MTIDRRSICLGAAAAAATGLSAASPRAAADETFFVSGPMSHNRLARMFVAPSSPLVLPDTPLLSAKGRQKLSDLRGKTYLVSLWAEWCAPCLEEATDLAAINRKHGGPSFEVLFVLTSSGQKLDLAAAQALMAKRGAADAPLLVEPNGKAAVFEALATQELPQDMREKLKKTTMASLPCNLLVDRHGRVRARSFGAMQSTDMKVGAAGSADHHLTDADKARVLTEHTDWASPVGDEFARALAAGVLEKA